MKASLEARKGPHLRDILVIALPMVVSQASETVMLFVDRLFLSRLGKLYISASMSGGLTTFNIMSLFWGILGYVNAVVAQHDGAGDKRSCARATAQAVRLAFVSWPLLLLSIPLIRMFFGALGHGPEQIALEMTYFRILIYGSLFGLLRAALAGFFIGLGRTRVVMIANIIGMAVNLPANYVLIFGKLGVPAMGIAGAAWGTNFGTLTIFLILLGVYLSKKYREEYGTAAELGFSKRLMRTLLEFGTPAGVEVFLNVAAFNLFIQSMHSYGPDVAAAVTIAFNYDMVAFVPMMGLGFAATTLTGRFVGAKDFPGAERATWLTLRVAWVYAAIMMAIFLIGARPLVALFSDGFPGGAVDVAPLGRTMLRLAAFYTLADATNLLFAGALRGAGDTKFVMALSVGLHWVFAAMALVLIRVLQIPPVSMWIIFIGFVIVLGSSMYARFRSRVWQSKSLVDNKGKPPRRPRRPVVPTDAPI